MKRMTIWRRLNSSLALLVALLLVGAALALGVQWLREEAKWSELDMFGGATQVNLQLVRLSDSLRGVMLDPKDDQDRKSGDEAATQLLDNGGLIMKLEQHAAEGDHAELDKSLEKLRVHATALRTARARLTELLDNDPAAALIEYGKTYPALRTEREALVRDFLSQVSLATKAEADRARDISWAGCVLLGLIFLASVWVAAYQSTSITKPLAQLVEAMERMRQGNFTRRLAVERRDEFGVLGEGLNRLADDLSALVGQVQRSGIQVNTTATQIAATARQQQSTASEIAATTAEIGATSKQISATSRELVKTMNEVSDLSEDTGELAGSGQGAIASMETTMRQIIEASGSVTAKLAVLNEKTSNINSVVTTITKVADQTNLLSLNAAIEAEKAGEYGLGFAVVAMEIRRLADQTAVATYDIEKMVKEMRSAVSAGVMGMDKFSEEVRRGVGEIRHVSAQLAQIIHQVQALTPRFQTVNEGMQSQATGAHQISETLTQLSEAAHQTADSLRQSNQAIEQLNEAARSLQNSVTRFKLEESERA